jgi:hypothetical protein
MRARQDRLFECLTVSATTFDCKGELSMSIDLTSVKLAIIVANGFESDEVCEPRDSIHRAGATAMC